MAFIKSVSTLTTNFKGTITTTSRSENTIARNGSAKVAGAWVTFSDGTRFRLPTDYYQAELSLERGPPSKGDGTYVFAGVTYKYSRQSGSGGFGIGNYFSGNWIYRYSSLGIPSIIGAPSFVTDEENEAVTKSLNKLGDEKLNLGENLATLGQTSRMFINPLQSFVKMAKAYKNLPVGREIPWGKLAHMSYRDLIRGGYGHGIPETYLAYVYGFAPLMQDIFAAHELAKDAGKKPLLLNSKASSRRSYQTPSQFYINSSDGFEENLSVTMCNSITRNTLWAKLSSQFQYTRTLNQLSLLNPAALVWELVPFSFVIDWALPIGPVLNAMTAPAGLDFVGGSTSRRVSAAFRYTSLDRTGQSPFNFKENLPASGNLVYNGYRRKRLTTWPRPGLWYSSDPLGLHRDGSDRLVKGLALALAALPRSL